MVNENNDEIEPGSMNQFVGGDGVADPMGDILMMGGGETPKGYIREMLSPGDTEEDRYIRLRSEPKDISDWCDMAYEDDFVTNRGRPDESKLMAMEQLLQVGLYGEGRHEAVMMYTRIMTQFTGPGKWQAAASRALGRRNRNEGGER